MANFFSRWHARRYSRSNRATWTAVDSPGKSMASDAAAGSSPDTVPVAVQPSWRGTALVTSSTVVSVQVGPLCRNDWSTIGENHLGQDEINGVGQTDDPRRHRHAIHLLRQQPARFAPVAVLCVRESDDRGHALDPLEWRTGRRPCSGTLPLWRRRKRAGWRGFL